MPETVYRESRTYMRDRPDSDDDDHHSRGGPTVRRYKVTTNQHRAPAPPPPVPAPVEYERTERIVERDYPAAVIEDDRRSHFSSHTHASRHPGRSSGDLLEVDTTRRVYLPERPRSAFDAPAQRNTTIVEKVVERERERSPVQEFYDVTRRSVVKDDGRTVIYEKTKEVEREDPYPPPQERTRTVVEKKTVERERDEDRYWDAHDHNDRSRTVVEKKVVERERDEDRYWDTHDHNDRSRTVVEKKVVEREDDHYWDDRGGDRGGALVYEKTKEIERVPGPTSPRSPREWDRHSHSPWDRDNVDVRLERRIERRDDGVDVTIQTRREERRDETPHGEFEHIRKETEYYEPAPPDPAPIIIRQRAPEQRIIVQEAPEPAPIIVPYRQQNEVAVARRDPREDDYYYRHREVERYDGRRVRDEDYAVYRHGRSRDRYSEGDRSDDDDVYVRRTIIKRERSKSTDHHKRHLAEGAVAGAGLAALVASRGAGGRESYGQSSGRGRKVLAGAALGALGTEVVKRARSAYNDRYGDDHDREYGNNYYAGRGRSRSRPGERYDRYDRYDDEEDDRGDDKKDKHSKIKTGLGLAAAALAVAGAAKYLQSQKIEKEELRRGRSRNRRGGYDSDSDSYYSRSRSRGPKGPRSPSRGGGIAKAAAGTAAVAGLVQHFRNKSKARSESGKGSKSRSRSRLRTGAEIVAAGLAGAAGKKLYDKHRNKQDASRERERELSDEEYEREQRERDTRSRSRSRRGGRRDTARSRSRSVSRSRSRSRNPHHPTTAAADPELGLVEYGGHAIYSDSAPVYHPDDLPPYSNGPPAVDAAEERRRRRAERLARNRERNRSQSEYSDGDDTLDETNGKKAKRARSRSRFRDMAAGAAAAAAAGIGIKKYEDAKKDKKKAESREHSRERVSPEREERRAERERARRERERDRRNYEDSITTDDTYDAYDPKTQQRPSSPPHASGGAYYGPPAADPELGHTTFAQGFTQHPNMATTDLHSAYRPYNPQEYVAYQPPPPPPGPPPNSAATPSGLPPPPTGGHRPDADHSSQTLLRHRKSRSGDKIDQDLGEDSNAHSAGNEDSAVVPQRRFRKRRRNSDPSNDRPLVSRHRDGPVESDRSSSASEEEIEVLPDRFDPHGRPINGLGSRQQRGWTERHGDFEYRNPRPGGTQVRGTWGVAGTDPEQVERMMQNVSGVLAGDMPRGVTGWLGLAGKLLGGVMAPEEMGHEEEEGRDHGEGPSRGRGERNIIAYGGGSDASRDERGKGRRRVDDHGYYEEEEEEAPRRRRRRRRRELE
ncbi:hypothetical protein N0V93_000670 [Gnomoniopsis smithogilvyi]|uniref:DUF3824 domain-containing protein n=1 Tax=Gnomoniopsis smithogilvyi TaxID=1191159 RepID=A0A9W8Z231_9PEZI|nr:hypothetical protein N0V93_000670 [Gnomoniopsis smithogilvyi]